MTQNFSGNKNPLIIFATYKPSAIVIDMKNSWLNLEKKNTKKVAKKLSPNITKILSKVNSTLTVSKNWFRDHQMAPWRKRAKENFKAAKNTHQIMLK